MLNGLASTPKRSIHLRAPQISSSPAGTRSSSLRTGYFVSDHFPVVGDNHSLK